MDTTIPSSVGSLLLAVSAMDAFRSEGIEFVTMGLVPFYDPSGMHIAPKIPSLALWSIRYWDRLYRFSGLQMFRSKFYPTRAESAYMLYWPAVLTPPMIWELISVLSAPSRKSKGENHITGYKRQR